MTRSKTLWRIAFIPVLLSFIGFATFSAARPVHASTITVQSTADTGGSCPGATCTLRTALITAVTGDTINFSLSYPATITVGTALTFTGKNNITIDGPGADKLTISGGNTSRVFLINSAISVTINRVKIADGKTSGTYVSTNAFAFGPGMDKPIAGKWVAASRPPLSGVVNSGAQTGGSSNASDTDRAD